MRAIKEWRISEEQFIRANAGKVTLAEMAEHLGRSEGSVKKHAHDMRRAGKLDKTLRPDLEEIQYRYKTRVCPRCGKRRKLYSGDVCRVCYHSDLRESHRERMLRAWENLPKEIQERTAESCEVMRSPSLFKTPLSKPKKKPPKREGTFWQQAAEDAYAIEMEAYELRQINMDIDALKQRRSKWKRKAARYYQEQEAKQ